jgi:hypothetical protein
MCEYVTLDFGNFFITMNFKSQRTWTTSPTNFTDQMDTVCYISEINQVGYESNLHPIIYGNCIGGMLFDKEGFGQYSNFHEVAVALFENFMQKVNYEYEITNTPNIAVDLVPDYVIPTVSAQFAASQSNLYDSIKFKLFNETLNTCKAVVSNIKGDSDTTDWTYSVQTTSGDNSKDLKFLFHNLPLLTYRNNTQATKENGIDFNVFYRKTINIGTLVYLSDDGIVRKVDSQCGTSWFYDYIDYSTTIDTSQTVIQQIITEQQQSGLMQNACFAIVQFMGLSTFKLAEFRTRASLLKPEKFSKYGTVNYYGLNPVIGDWDPSGTLARGTITKYNLDIWSGMADVTMMLNGVQT